MKTIFAVAKQTLLQCLRMKTALGVLIMLALTLIFMPNLVSGDGTLAGQIRSLLTYGIGLTTFLLAVFTILVTVSIITEDIRNKTIILIVVKPISRWKYLLGRWLGIIVLDLVLCAITFTGVYVGVLFLRNATSAGPEDRTTIETEIFTAREIISPRVPDFDAIARAKINELKKDKVEYQRRLQSYSNEKDWRKRSSEERLYDYYYARAKNEVEIKNTGGQFLWVFDNIKLSNLTITEKCDLYFQPSRNRFVFTADKKLLGRLKQYTPIYVNDMKALVTKIGPTAFEVSFKRNQIEKTPVKNITSDKSANITVTPVCQLRYTAQIFNRSGTNEGFQGAFKYRLFWGGYDDPKDANSQSIWTRNSYDMEDGTAKTGAASEFNIMPEHLGKANNTLGVVLYNGGVAYTEAQEGASPNNSLTLKIGLNTISLMVPVESFTSNYIKAVLLIFLQLLFLAALGIFFSTFLSFPISMIACSVFLLGGIMFGSIQQSIHDIGFANEEGVLPIMSKIAYGVISFIMPDISAMTPSDKLADGMLISWSKVFSLGGINAVCRGIFYLLIGCGIFYKREISQVQV